ncbi:MAG: 4-hydroxy-3-methylbut-2-enyl diphosphate reductase, partial [Pseudomonadota bacterium]|nr:4-hydroxy-3-methylbut-2-enyl diphosphate reductase [Pseudomonadota bacterium]
IPDGGITIFSAHGISEKVEKEARLRALPVIDATCPLVSKVHKEGQVHSDKGREVILIGHSGHPEVEGTMGRIKGGVHLVTNLDDVAQLEVTDTRKLAYVTQTTLSVDDTRGIISALKQRFPDIIGPDVRDICYATQNRQKAVRALSSKVDLLIVVGAQNSSNSNRLKEIGEEMGIPAYLIDDANGLRLNWLKGAKSVGISAGASAPEELVEELIVKIGQYFDVALNKLDGIEESVQFNLPSEILKPPSQANSSASG